MIEKAEKYALRIKDWDEQLFTLQYIATTKSITAAIDQALSLKKYDDLIENARFIEKVGMNPTKYHKVIVNDGMMHKLEKGLAMRK